MGNFDYDYNPKASRGCFSVFWNLLTVIALVCVVCVAAIFFLLFTNPYLPINPFPPPTLPALAALPTLTNTSSVVMPATWTPTMTYTPTPSETPEPTSTLPPTPTPITFPPTPTDTLTPPPGGYPFDVQSGSPVAVANIYHPELGCDWMGVGGQAVDMSNSPVTGLIISLGGKLPGVSIPDSMMSLTGIALNYGRAGYEFTLADHPIASSNMVWVQLLDQAGLPISERVFFDTYDTCDRNLIIINFKQVRK
jgi:hypothetical protein